MESLKSYKSYRKISILFFVLLYIILFSSQSFAGVGLYIGGMTGTVDSYSSSFKFDGDPAGYSNSQLIRDKSKASSLIGLNYTFHVYKKFDLSVGIEFTGLIYEVQYIPALESNQGGTMQKGDMASGRLSLETTALYNVKSVQIENLNIGFFGGAGLSMASFMMPATSDELIANVSSADKKVDLDKHALGMKSRTGANIMAAIKFKTIYTKLGFQVFAKYNVYSKIDDDVSSSAATFGFGLFWNK